MDSVMLPGGLVELRLAENPGSFLSLGAMLPASARFGIFTLGVGIGLVALFAYLASRARIDLICFMGLSFVMAGGMSNLLDRIFRHGLVTDFVTIHVGPIHTGVFNAADVLVMVGFALIIWRFRRGGAPDGPITQKECLSS
jgi:signal peptidase II